MKEESPFDLFSAVSRKAKKKQEVNPTAAPPSSMKEEKKGDMKEEEVGEMFVKMEEYREDLEKKLEDVYEKSLLTPKKVEQCLALFNEVFSLEEYYIDKKKLEDKVSAVMGSEGSGKKESSSKEEKGRKGKSLGARKQWLPMK